METVRIHHDLGGSFEIPRKDYLEAQTFATLRNQIWFVGLKTTSRENQHYFGPSDTIIIHPDRLALYEQGCSQVAWVCPMRSELA